MYNQVATLWIQQDSNSSDSYYPLDHSQPALECIYPTSSSGTEFFCEILHLQLKQIPMKYVKHQPEDLFSSRVWMIPDFAYSPDVNIETNAHLLVKMVRCIAQREGRYRRKSEGNHLHRGACVVHLKISQLFFPDL